MSEEKTQTPQTKADPFELGWRDVCQVNEKGQEVWVQVPLTQEDLLHPQEGDHVVQRSGHGDDCHYLRGVIQMALADREGFHVVYDLGFHWDVEDLGHHGPDITVFSRDKPGWKPRDEDSAIVHVKELGLTPLLAIEITSPSTRTNDLTIKVEEYHRAGLPLYAIVDYRFKSGVRELFVLGYRWTPEGFVPLPLDEQGRLWLEPVKLWLGCDGGRVVVFDEQGQRMPDILELGRNEKQLAMRLEEEQSNAEEAILARREAMQKLEQEKKARKIAESRATDEEKARKEAQTKVADEEKARKLAEQKAADQEQARKDAEQKAADEEKTRKLAEQKAVDLAARLAELEARLRLLGESTGDPS